MSMGMINGVCHYYSCEQRLQNQVPSAWAQGWTYHCQGWVCKSLSALGSAWWEGWGSIIYLGVGPGIARPGRTPCPARPKAWTLRLQLQAGRRITTRAYPMSKAMNTTDSTARTCTVLGTGIRMPTAYSKRMCLQTSVIKSALIIKSEMPSQLSWYFTFLQSHPPALHGGR